MRLPAVQFGLGRGQHGECLLPGRFQTACHQAVVGVDGQIAAFGPGRLVAGPLDLPAMLFQRLVVAVLQFPGGGQAGGDRVAGDGGQERLTDGGVDGHPADAQVTGVLARR